MSVDFHFNLNFGLKPEVDGIKIVNKRSIFQVEWLTATLITYFLNACFARLETTNKLAFYPSSKI